MHISDLVRGKLFHMNIPLNPDRFSLMEKIFTMAKIMHECIWLKNMPTCRFIVEIRFRQAPALGNPSKVMSKSVPTSEFSAGLILAPRKYLRRSVTLSAVEQGTISKNNSRGFTLRVRRTREINSLTFYLLLLYAFSKSAAFFMPGGYSQKNWVGVCGPLLRTLTLFMTKICDIPYPIYDLTKNLKPYL